MANHFLCFRVYMARNEMLEHSNCVSVRITSDLLCAISPRHHLNYAERAEWLQMSYCNDLQPHSGKKIYVPQHRAHAHTQTHIPNLEHPAERYLARARTLAWTCAWTSIRENDCLQEQVEKKMHASASTHSTRLAPVFHFAFYFYSRIFEMIWDEIGHVGLGKCVQKNVEMRLHQMGGCYVHERHSS